MSGDNLEQSGTTPSLTPTRAWSSRLMDAATSLLVFVAFMGAWFLAAASVSPLIIPHPVDVFWSFYESIISLRFWEHTAVTLIEIILGFVFGSALGVGFGICLSESAIVRRVLGPYMTAAAAVPKFSLAPILVIWFGFGIMPKVIIAGLVAFFPLMENTMVGLQAVEPDALRMFQSLRASRWQILTKLRFPTAVPYVFAGLRVAMVFALLGAIVGEYVGANAGLGALLLYAQGTIDTPLMFTTIIVMSLLGVVLYRLVSLAEWLVLRRQRAG